MNNDDKIYENQYLISEFLKEDEPSIIDFLPTDTDDENETTSPIMFKLIVANDTEFIEKDEYIRDRDDELIDFEDFEYEINKRIRNNMQSTLQIEPTIQYGGLPSGFEGLIQIPVGPDGQINNSDKHNQDNIIAVVHDLPAALTPTTRQLKDFILKKLLDNLPKGFLELYKNYEKSYQNQALNATERRERREKMLGTLNHIHFDIDEFIKCYGLSYSNKREIMKNLEEAIKIFTSSSFKWTLWIKNDTDKKKSIKYTIESNYIDATGSVINENNVNGEYKIILTNTFMHLLFTRGVLQHIPSVLLHNKRKGNYMYVQALATLQNWYIKHPKNQANIISLRNFLSYLPDIPSYKEVANSPKKEFRRLIINKVFEILDYLSEKKGRGLVKYYFKYPSTYTQFHQKPLSKEEIYKNKELFDISYEAEEARTKNNRKRLLIYFELENEEIFKRDSLKGNQNKALK